MSKKKGWIARSWIQYIIFDFFFKGNLIDHLKNPRNYFLVKIRWLEKNSGYILFLLHYILNRSDEQFLRKCAKYNSENSQFYFWKNSGRTLLLIIISTLKLRISYFNFAHFLGNYSSDMLKILRCDRNNKFPHFCFSTRHLFWVKYSFKDFFKGSIRLLFKKKYSRISSIFFKN